MAPMMRLFAQKERVQAGLGRTRATWFGRIAGLLHSPSLDDAAWEELEEALIGADVGVGLATRLIQRVKDRNSREQGKGGSAGTILQEEALRILDGQPQRSPLLSLEQGAALPARPYVVLVVGVNGTGKTTSIAKLARLLSEQGRRVILAAADTFRAGGIEQLDIWAARAGAQMIAHQTGADPGAVTYDALQAARARNADVVIIDTAGRLHTKVHLMEELRKIHRVIRRFDPAAPHESILVIDATTGQNGLAQARNFAEAVGVSGLFLAKLDGTARGGIALAIADQLGLPILFVGTGEQLDDLAPFDPGEFVEALFAPEA